MQERKIHLLLLSFINLIIAHTSLIMKSFFAPLVAVAFLASSASAQFTINSLLNVVVCQPSLITWTGGVSPYFLVRFFALPPPLFRLKSSTVLFVFLQSILPANQPSATALVDLGQQNGNSVTWLANLGTSAFLNLRDSTGALAQSGTFTVLTGANTTCVGQAAVTSAGPAASGSTPVATTSGAAAATTSGGAAATSKSSTTTSGSATKPSASSAAISKYASAGAVAMLGSAMLALVV
ncbi:hypothetical protein BDZ97DRAFT_2073211 [Flammula alnicola]|nr:hypothetical protein BDZ97DRAFT_2073211 [Flammula alnicola]